ncbi:unnamed protein product [Schistocephalus solidus]|uniref:Reverse transcriptase domain-containing protein n=1 Tax=Schistocephalus solidus TaxID=70667 RepID=A0A183SZI9_SCHSO|nr:unnamed protein product [Schistocephalus solidus]
MVADNATVETRWCQLRNVIQSTALEVLERARRQHQDWFDNNDADISNLLAEKNGLHKAYMDLRTDAAKAAFFICQRLVRQRLRKISVLNCSSAISDAQDFQGVTIVHLYKGEEIQQLCDNHTGISLINIAGKIFARILLNRLNGHLEQGLLPERQFHYLLFAEDCALNIVTEEDMQISIDLFTAGCADFGLTISTAKTVVMHPPPPSAEYNAPLINVNGAQLKNVETFAYLGSMISRNTIIV